MRAVLAARVAGVGQAGVVRVVLAVRAVRPRAAAARIAGRCEHGERAGGGQRRGAGRGCLRLAVHASRVYHQLIAAESTQKRE